MLFEKRWIVLPGLLNLKACLQQVSKTACLPSEDLFGEVGFAVVGLHELLQPLTKREVAEVLESRLFLCLFDQQVGIESFFG
jgi:hypothetical protein